MPTYAYKCESCESKFEMYHKSIPVVENVVCPSCSSDKTMKLITAPNIGSMTKSAGMDMPPCSTGACNSGMCSMAGN